MATTFKRHALVDVEIPVDREALVQDRAVGARQQVLTPPEGQVVRRRAQFVGAAPGPASKQRKLWCVIVAEPSGGLAAGSVDSILSPPLGVDLCVTVLGDGEVCKPSALSTESPCRNQEVSGTMTDRMDQNVEAAEQQGFDVRQTAEATWIFRRGLGTRSFSRVLPPLPSG